MNAATERNKAVVENATDAILRSDVAALDRYVSEDVVRSDPFRTIEGLDAYREYIRSFVSSYSDLEAEVEDMVGEDDRVVVHFTFRGTHDGEFAGIEPTGNEVELPALALYRLEQGKIVEETELWDNLDFIQQLGLDPSDL